jgi:hypothetical protein
MQLLEKKYQLDSFTPILKIIKEKKLIKLKEVASVHYYAKHEGNDIEKFVEYPDRVEVHVWKEVNGEFTPTENFLIKDKSEGLAWLKRRGNKIANIVKMDYTEYEYKNGTVGLYTIDDFHHSIILNFSEGEHENVEKDFGLQKAETITVPYNKMLEKMGKLRSINLD